MSTIWRETELGQHAFEDAKAFLFSFFQLFFVCSRPSLDRKLDVDVSSGGAGGLSYSRLTLMEFAILSATSHENYFSRAPTDVFCH